MPNKYHLLIIFRVLSDEDLEFFETNKVDTQVVSESLTAPIKTTLNQNVPKSFTKKLRRGFNKNAGDLSVVKKFNQIYRLNNRCFTDISNRNIKVTAFSLPSPGVFFAFFNNPKLTALLNVKTVLEGLYAFQNWVASVIKKLKSKEIITEIALIEPLVDKDVLSTYLPESLIEFVSVTPSSRNVRVPLRINKGIVGTLINSAAENPLTKDDVFLMISKNQSLEELADLNVQLQRLSETTIYGSFKLIRLGALLPIDVPQSGQSNVGRIDLPPPSLGGRYEMTERSWGDELKPKDRFKICVKYMEVGDTGISVQEGELLENWEIVHIYIEELPPKLPPRDGVPVDITVPTNGPAYDPTKRMADLYRRFQAGVKSMVKAAKKVGLKTGTSEVLLSFLFFFLWLIGQSLNEDEENSVDTSEQVASTKSYNELFGELAKPDSLEAKSNISEISPYASANDFLSMDNINNENFSLPSNDEQANKSEKNNKDDSKGG